MGRATGSSRFLAKDNVYGDWPPGTAYDARVILAPCAGVGRVEATAAEGPIREKSEGFRAEE